MIAYFADRLAPPDFDPQNPLHRQRYGARAGTIGVILNLLLSLSKCSIGLFTGSIAVIADGLNNLSDGGASLVTLAGFRLAGVAADEDHPFGHGRMEYLSGLIVALAIILMGFEVGQNSLLKLFSPESIDFSWLTVIILALSILIKLWMGAFYHLVAGRLDSVSLEAAAADSKSDVIATGLVLVATLVEHFSGIQIDAFAGLLVSAFILKAGWEATRDATDPLLGRSMSGELAADIHRIVQDHPNILGMHDIIYHDYGPGRAMMSFHVEVPADGNLLELHEIIDHIERELKESHHIETVIHMDPVSSDKSLLTLREQVFSLVRKLDPVLTIHDFRVSSGDENKRIIFDVVVPYGFYMDDEAVRHRLTDDIATLSPDYSPIIIIDHSYISEATN